MFRTHTTRTPHSQAGTTTRPTARPRRGGRVRRVTALIAAPAMAIAISAAVGASPASATTVPGPPSGWSTVFSDGFSGSAGSGIDSQ